MVVGFEQEPERRRRIDSSSALLVVLAVALAILVFGTLRRAGILARSDEPETIVLAESGKDIRAIAEAGALPQVEVRSPRARIHPEDESATHVRYPVYFGTDRLPAIPYDGVTLASFLWLAAGWCLAVVASAMLLARGTGRGQWWTAALLVLGSCGLAFIGIFDPKPAKQNPFEAYGDGRGQLQCGVCVVSIPHDHKPGALEAPSILRFEFREDPSQHVVLQRVEPLDMEEFRAELKDRVESVAWPEALVFVHGYNVSFENAARRTAQLAHDVRFGGLAAFYSWPSNGHTLAYTWDEQSAEYTVEHLKAFLELLARTEGLRRIHVVAHSMGNRCVLSALKEKVNFGECGLDQCVFAAPDVDRDQFARDVQRLTAADVAADDQIGRVTLYASANDRALNASQKAHRFPRAGDARGGVLLVEGIDAIDASLLETDYLGHSYFGDSPHVIEDLRQMIEDRSVAAKRKGMVEMRVGRRRYWEFQP